MGTLKTAAALLLLGSVAGRAQVAATQPDVAALIRDARHAEDWLDQVKSLRVKLNASSNTSMIIIQARVEAARKQEPDVDPASRPDLSPSSHFTTEIVFVPQRSRLEVTYADGPTLTVAWDGTREVTRRVSKGTEEYAIRPQFGPLIDRMMAELQFGRMMPHPYWWVTPEHVADMKKSLAQPEQYTLIGRENFHGTDCYVVTIGLVNWYIGAADHRIYGRVRNELPKASGAEAERRIIAVARKFGSDISRIKEWNAWHDMLPAAKQTEVDAAYSESVRPLCKPREEGWCANYQELGPGRFFPLKQGRSLRDYEGSTNAELEHFEYAVAEVEINPTLDPAQFIVHIPAGAAVRDETVKPPRIYRPATTRATTAPVR